MNMPSGTKVRDKKGGAIYILHDYVNEKARLLVNQKYVGMVDYINKNTQFDYEVVECVG